MSRLRLRTFVKIEDADGDFKNDGFVIRLTWDAISKDGSE